MTISHAMIMRRYKFVFTDGIRPRYTFSDAPDIEFAKMKARTMSQEIMQQRVFGEQNWTKWRFVVYSAEEGRAEGSFIENWRAKKQFDGASYLFGPLGELG